MLDILKYMAAALDRLLFASLNRVVLRRVSRDIEILCFCPEGTGNLGSRALLEASLENLGPNAVYLGFDAELFHQAGIGPEQSVVISNLYPNFTFAHFRAVYLSARLIARAKSVYVVGADNLDGAWSDMLSAVIWQFAIAAAKSGSKATVLGSSWNSKPTKFSKKCLKRASQSGVIVNARDSDSFRRMSQIVTHNVFRTADIVFSTQLNEVASKESTWLQVPLEKFTVLCGNPGFTLEPSNFSPEKMRLIFEELSKVGPILLVPSVVREHQNDLAQIQRIYNHFKQDFQLGASNYLPSPNELRKLLRQSEMLVTFRMHPAILALSESKPVVMFDYQDKMRGLAHDVGIEEFCVNNADWARAGSDAIRSAVLQRSNIVQKLMLQIPSIKILARKNFS